MSEIWKSKYFTHKCYNLQCNIEVIDVIYVVSWFILMFFIVVTRESSVLHMQPCFVLIP